MIANAVRKDVRKAHGGQRALRPVRAGWLDTRAAAQLWAKKSTGATLNGWVCRIRIRTLLPCYLVPRTVMTSIPSIPQTSSSPVSPVSLGKKRPRTSASASEANGSGSPAHAANGSGGKKIKKKKSSGFANAPGASSTSNGHVNGHANGSSGPAAARSAADPRIEAVRQKLPIWTARDAIVDKIKSNETIILLADTGSGKSTQIPQFLHHAGFTSASSPSSPLPLRMIGITQPRRMAAISLAKRVAQELGTSDPGDDDSATAASRTSAVGFAIRFQDRTTKHTRIKFMTDGWLLREFVRASTALVEQGLSLEDIKDPQHPSLLPQYSVLIIDEAHERSVRSDLVLGLAKRVQKRRRELRKAWEERRGGGGGDASAAAAPQLLRMVIMSATLDAELFSDFFADENAQPAPVVYVKGRMHSVTLHHLHDPVNDWVDAAKRQVLNIHVSQPLRPGVATPTTSAASPASTTGGDILVFGTGAEEIEALTTTLRQLAEQLPVYANDRERLTGKPTHFGKLLVVPLYAALGSKAVAAVFKPTPPGTRKVVIATNIAETSVTIPGIRYVIDCGLAKERMHISQAGIGGQDSRYGAGADANANTSIGIETLTTRAISQSAASQRAGRAGRESAGECYRLYPRSAFEGMSMTTVPEIHRTDLGSVALDCFSAGVDPREIDWVEAPEDGKLHQAVLELAAMGALESSSGDGARLTLTSLGRKMSLLPLPPRFSLLLLTASAKFSPAVTAQARDLVAILSSERNIFVEPAFASADGKNGKDAAEQLEEKRIEAEKAKAVFRHRSGDHVTMLRAFYRYQQAKSETAGHVTGENATPEQRLRSWCNKHFISQRTMREVEDIREQLEGICKRAGIDTCGGGGENMGKKQKKARGSAARAIDPDDDGGGGSSDAFSDDALTVTKGGKSRDTDLDGIDADADADADGDYTDLRKCLISGRSTTNIALRKDDGSYRRLCGNEVFKLHPTSSLHSRNARGEARRPALILFEELVFTTQLYVRCATEIDVEWLQGGR